VEYWSTEFEPMTNYMHFVHKLKTLSFVLPILHEEKVKDVLFDSDGTLLIHRESTRP
jgi:hypothetical protein